VVPGRCPHWLRDEDRALTPREMKRRRSIAAGEVTPALENGSIP
jgi:hypothetical protein